MFLVDCSNSSWKFDKFDLLFVVFLLFIMVCNVTFCVEPEEVSTFLVSNVFFSSNSTIVYSSQGSIRYFPIEKGYKYTISYNTSNVIIGFLDRVPVVGDVYNRLGTLSGNGTYIFNVYDDSYFAFGWSWGSDMIITREPLTDMGGVVNILSNDVGTNQFWHIFTLAIPFILIVVLVVLGFFIIRGLLKKGSKGDIRF